MARIDLDKATSAVLARRVRDYLKDEAGVEIDPVDALRLLDFLAEALGPHYYNQALIDAEAVLGRRHCRRHSRTVAADVEVGGYDGLGSGQFPAAGRMME